MITSAPYAVKRYRYRNNILTGNIVQGDGCKRAVSLLYIKDHTIYPIEIKKGIGKDKADKNFKVLEQYKMPIATGLVIDTSARLFPLNRETWYCPVGMIGL